MPTKKAAKKVKAGRRELIDTGTDKRYVKRKADGTFKESDDVGKSLAADRRKKAKTKVKAGYGGYSGNCSLARALSSSGERLA